MSYTWQFQFLLVVYGITDNCPFGDHVSVEGYELAIPKRDGPVADAILSLQHLACLLTSLRVLRLRTRTGLPRRVHPGLLFFRKPHDFTRSLLPHTAGLCIRFRFQVGDAQPDEA